MPRTTAVRTYGKRARKPRADVLLEEQHTEEKQRLMIDLDGNCEQSRADEVSRLAEQIESVRLDDRAPAVEPELKPRSKPKAVGQTKPDGHSPDKPPEHRTGGAHSTLALPRINVQEPPKEPPKDACDESAAARENLRTLTWADVCPPGDRIEKIAEASYAEVYRISNDLGTSIIKVIRLESPIKPQTKAQERSGLVDEEPHGEADMAGELKISEWLADIPGFVVYKERYTVRGKATKELLETHQTFHRRMKRKDPDRLQFYPSPSRYLHETEFLVIELGDAGTSLEDFELVSPCQLWDIFLLVAIALARAENLVWFEHRDLHEGNLCVRQVRPPRDLADGLEDPLHQSSPFGRSGLEITILDYGLSRAEDPDSEEGTEPVAFDLEKDLSLFTSTHAAQCKVYRRMRSFLIKGDRVLLPPEAHTTPYPCCDSETADLSSISGPGGNGGGGGGGCSSRVSERISWSDYNPYSNVLWLAYIYEYLTKHFRGDRKELTAFKRETREAWTHLNPDAPPGVMSFSSATDVVRFTVEAGWVTERQLAGADPDSSDLSELLDRSLDLDGESILSIVEQRIVDRDETKLRRSPRRRRQIAVS